MHRTKSYYHDFFKHGAISKSHPCKADVLAVQLKQSNFMTSAENVNKLCLFVQCVWKQNICRFILSEHMKCLQVHRRQLILLIQHSGRMKVPNTEILNLAHRIYLHSPSVLTSIGSLDYMRITY